MRTKGFGKKLLTIFKGTVGYSVYVLFNLVFIVLALLLYVFTFPFPKARRNAVSFCLTKILSLIILILDLIGVAKIKVRGAENILKDKKAIYVANHRSLLDSVFLLSKIPHSTVLVKSAYMPLLAIGILIKLFDFIAIDKDSKPSIVSAREKSRRLLNEGISIIVFPESTRSPSSRMLEFGSLAFRLAAENDAPLVPVAIYQRGILLNKGKGTFFPPEKDCFTISFLEPIMPEENKSPKELLNIANRQIMRETARLKTEDSK